MEEEYKNEYAFEEEHNHKPTKEEQNGDNSNEDQNEDNSNEEQNEDKNVKPLKTYSRVRGRKIRQFRNNRSSGFKIFRKGNERGAYKNSSVDSVNGRKKWSNYKLRRTFGKKSSTVPFNSNNKSSERTRFTREVRPRDRTMNSFGNFTGYKTLYPRSKFNQGGTYNKESRYKPYNNKQKQNSKTNSLSKPLKYTKNYTFYKRCTTNSYTFIKPGDTNNFKYLKPPTRNRTSKRSYGDKPKYNSTKPNYRGKNF